MTRPTQKPASSAQVQVRMMIILSVFFFGGVTILSFFPEDSGPVRGIALGIFSPLMIYCLYRFSRV